MNRYEVVATRHTPHVYFDPQSGKLLLEGESMPENSLEVFLPLLDQLDRYFSAPKKSLLAEIKLDYFSTSSSKMVYELIFRLQKAHENGHDITLNVYYLEGDTDMMEDWEDITSDTSLNCNIIEYSN